METVLTVAALVAQYLLLPVNALLTLGLPIAVYFACRRLVWGSIPLAVAVELLLRWGDFVYYESRGLLLLMTLAQVAVMAAVILLLRALVPTKGRA